MDRTEFEQIVSSLYEGLFAFALSLVHNRDEACELTQETFSRLASKGHQLRDRSKIKSWLFTTLYRVFLAWRRRETRLPHLELDSVSHELPAVAENTAESADAGTILDRLWQIEERYRAPLVLFYLENHSYREIAEILDIPPGTVMSRLSRGKTLLREALACSGPGPAANILKINPASLPHCKP